MLIIRNCTEQIIEIKTEVSITKFQFSGTQSVGYLTSVSHQELELIRLEYVPVGIFVRTSGGIGVYFSDVFLKKSSRHG